MELNIKKWYEENYSSIINKETEFYVNAFSIIWGVYECKLYNNDFCVERYKIESNRILAIVTNNKELISTILNFVERIKGYCNKKNNGDINQIYENFLFANKAKKLQFMVSDLNRYYFSEELGDKIYLLITLLGRVRNNFLHGEKVVYDLDNQIELFKVLEEFMIFSLSVNLDE